MVCRCDRRSFWLRVLYVFLQSTLPLVNLYVLKHLIDVVSASVFGSAEATAFLPYLLVMTAVFLLNRVVSALNSINNDVLTQRLTDYLSDNMQRQAARLDLSYYDTPSYHDTFHRAQQEAGFRPVRILDCFMAVGGSLVSIIGVTAMLVSASWWVVIVMIVAVLPSLFVRMYKARCIYSFRRNNTQLYRRTSYYSHLLTSREAAKEMRAYRLAPRFRRLFVEVRVRLVDRLLRISRRMGLADIFCAFVEAVAMLAIVWLLARRAFDGVITVGTFVMLFEAFRRGQGYLTALVGGIAGLYDNRLFVSNLFDFLRLVPSVLPPDKPLSVPENIETVELCDVTFRYPDMSRDVLSHFSLIAKIGEVTRLEGQNGYGKSTVIKLLLRLYDPQQGTVLLNGIDVRRFDPTELRSRMGVLFQDFMCYNCSLRENISPSIEELHAPMGADPYSWINPSSRPLLDFTDRLPHGPDTMLGRMFDGGQELSMGQWQRLALLRALQSDAPILLLDEPLAWLDSNARQHFYSIIDQLKKNKIIILITHA